MTQAHLPIEQHLITWSPLHDYTLLYVAFLHGSPSLQHAFNPTLVLARMRRFRSHMPGRYLRHVYSQVMLTYLVCQTADLLEGAVVQLADCLPTKDRAHILLDIAQTVCQNGLYYPEDADFIEHIARSWDVEHHLRASADGVLSTMSR